MASLQVLVNAHLLCTITAYQDGIFVEMLPQYAAWKQLLLRPSSLSMPATLQPADLVISSLADKRYILHAAVARHDVSCVERLLLCYRRDLITSDLMACAARHGHLDLMQRFHLRGIPCSSKAMDLAATYGHLQVLTFLHVHAGEGCSDRAMVGAAEAGHLAIVQFLHTARPEQPTSFRAMDYAARNGHFEIVKFLHYNRPEGASAVAIDFAASHGHLEIVQFLHTHRHEGCSTYAMDGAVRNGHLDIVRFLHAHRTEGCSKKALLYALQHQLHDILPILRSYHGLLRPASSAVMVAARARAKFSRVRTRRRYFLTAITVGR